jgi:glucose-6-phosphate 1-dehydrogenase
MHRDDNPFTAGLRGAPVPDPCTLVIFGATGDLTRRKLLPALYNLYLEGLIDPCTSVVGVARRVLTDDVFRDRMRQAVEQHSRRDVDEEDWRRFAAGLRYLQGDFDDGQAYSALSALLSDLDDSRQAGGRRIFYLATPPSAYPVIVGHLGEAGLSRPAPEGVSRVIVEKPFGRDLASARQLNEVVGNAFQENQVYRIDHYLGKETVQNILVFRLGNGIFEPLWNRRYVDHVQITVAESLGVEGRGAYYDRAGILRDMFQNHMMQLLCLVAMEPPVRFEADAVRDEKVKVLRALRLPEPSSTSTSLVRGYYTAGATGGRAVPGYRDEPEVPPDSPTETFLAARLDVENWRWAGVPFFLRSGKRLPRRVTEIALVFRRPPHLFFPSGPEALTPNVLALRIQPDEGISLSFGSKKPGQEMHVENVRMDFLYSTSFGGAPPEAYEHLLLDCIEGDSTLFARRDEVELAWGIADGLRQGWETAPLHPYEAGTWGPAEARTMPGTDRRWRRI